MTGDIARPRRKNRYLRKKTDTKKERTATKGGRGERGGVIEKRRNERVVRLSAGRKLSKRSIVRPG